MTKGLLETSYQVWCGRSGMHRCQSFVFSPFGIVCQGRRTRQRHSMICCALESNKGPMDKGNGGKSGAGFEERERGGSASSPSYARISVPAHKPAPRIDDTDSNQKKINNHDAMDQLELRQRLREVRVAMQEAVEMESYVLAATLRDEAKELELMDPMVPLQQELDLAVREERFGDAALLRDQIKELQPEHADTQSSTVTEGIRVDVQSFYFPEKSNPDLQKFIFLYRIKVTNESYPGKVKLVAREWHVEDEIGGKKTVKGPGVAGEQPELKPGQSFQYASVCPLQTPAGAMEGNYEFYAEKNGRYMKSFLVNIGRFILRTDGPKIS